MNNGDVDQDGIVDYFDGYGLLSGVDEAALTEGKALYPVVVSLPAMPDGAYIRIDYDGSDPLDVNTILGDDGPAPGHLRLWTKDGDVARDGRAVSKGGDYVAPGFCRKDELVLDLRNDREITSSFQSVHVVWARAV